MRLGSLRFHLDLPSSLSLQTKQNEDMREARLKGSDIFVVRAAGVCFHVHAGSV